MPDITTNRRNGSLWLMISVVSIYSWLAPRQEHRVAVVQLDVEGLGSYLLLSIQL